MSTKKGKGGDVNSFKNDEGATRKESKKVPETLQLDRVQDGFDIWKEESDKLLEKDLEHLRREQVSLAPENQKTEQQLKEGKPKFVFKRLETSIQQDMLNNIMEYERTWEGREQCRFMHCFTETCQHCEERKWEDIKPADPEGNKSEKSFLAYQKCVAGSSNEKTPTGSTRMGKGKTARTPVRYDPDADNFFDQL